MGEFGVKEYFSYLAEPLLSLHASHRAKMEARNTPFSQSEYPKTRLDFEEEAKEDVNALLTIYLRDNRVLGDMV